MSKILDYKKTIHIVSEVITLVVIFIYFFKKNKIAMKYIDDITTRLDIQEDIIQKYEKIIKKHDEIIKQLIINNQQHENKQINTNKIQNSNTLNLKNKKDTNKIITQNENKSKNNFRPLSYNKSLINKENNLQPVQTILLSKIEEVTSSSEDSDTLDDEIREELNELKTTHI